ncbi:hypothetical protein V2J09_007207 [Rumex salicifolius]
MLPSLISNFLINDFSRLCNLIQNSRKDQQNQDRVEAQLLQNPRSASSNFNNLKIAVIQLQQTQDGHCSTSTKSRLVQHRHQQIKIVALLAIKATIIDDPHSVLSSWNKSLHFCQWESVTCGNSHQRVVILHLSDLNLAGALSPFIGNLSFLHELYLSNNLFRGNIPHQISYLPRLHILMLGTNSFEGEIPANLSSCLHLNTLDLGFNNLVGEISRRLATLPDMIFCSAVRNNFIGHLKDIGIGNMSTSLQSLFLSFNSLEGSILLKGLAQLGLSLNILSGEIPSSLYNLSNLNVLDLSSNNLQGQLPQDLGLRLPLLSYIYVVECSLSGQFPNSISNLSELVSLEISNNNYDSLLAIKEEISTDPKSMLSSWNKSFPLCEWEGVECDTRHQRVVSLDLSSSNLVGTLSPFIGNLSFLHTLNLSNNFFHDHIPHQVSQLHRLQTLILSKNSFVGEIPSNSSLSLRLRVIDLSSNHLVGRIPSEVALLPNLVDLVLSSNNFIGDIEAIKIGNMSSSLQTLSLSFNHLHGRIPNDIGRLKSLTNLALNNNTLFGIIPTSLFNLSNLEKLDLSATKIQGRLPQDLGQNLPKLQDLILLNTSITGQVPTSLSNLSQLEILDISYNSFSGKFSFDANNLPYLSRLYVENAFSLGGEVRDMDFVDSLTNCSNLLYLYLGGNSFTGNFPHSILNLSTSLRTLRLNHNQLFGGLPYGIGKFVNLNGFDLEQNLFTGQIPADIGHLERMELLYFPFNNFSGEIPSSLGNLTRLNVLNMQYNNLEGSLPKSLGNCQYIQEIYLTHNKFRGPLPIELFHISSLLSVTIDHNDLQGSLPVDITRLQNLLVLVLSNNRFSGEIPSTFGGLKSLLLLDLSINSLVGSIPMSLSALTNTVQLELSCNHLSGPIPSYFSTWPYLLRLNLSFNALEGEVPTNGVFSNTSIVFVFGNNKLCGGVPGLHLPKCPSKSESHRRRLSLTIIMIISIVCGVMVVLSIACCIYFLCSSRKGKKTSSGLEDIRPFLEVSYQMLSRATNGFSLSNLLGAGGFGSVYKGILHQDDTELEVAVKVMNLRNEGASKSFIGECKALRNIRHRNLVKVITACSSIDTQRNDFKALVYEFMPRGSLESWLLHSSNLDMSEHVDGDRSCGLSLFQRLNITIDVACALEYLHIGCASSIIHCDLKPSNILLDDDMIAHVGDFGLAKFILGVPNSSIENQSSSTQVIRGTVGYAAPEYGIGSKASVEADMYSFGIVVLEMMTSRKPTDPMFNEGLNLHEFARTAFPDRVMEIIDQRMLGDVNMVRARSVDIRGIECIKSLVRIGVQCSMELPQERVNIETVVNELQSTRKNLLDIGCSTKSVGGGDAARALQQIMGYHWVMFDGFEYFK